VRIIPLTLAQVNDLVAKLHRHHKPARGHRFSLGVVRDDGELCGAAIVGRPVARKVPQYEVAEVTRLVTDGTPNACSILYGAAARVAKEMGFTSIQTYTLESEPGTSLAASGWKFVRRTAGGDWNWHGRDGRRTDQPMAPKKCWVRRFDALAGLEDVL
jgi:hypothetical protein